MAVSGPALEKLGARIPADVTIVPSDLWTPKAATVGNLGWRRYQSGERDDLWQLVPIYFRPSAAEEKLAAQAQFSRAALLSYGSRLIDRFVTGLSLLSVKRRHPPQSIFSFTTLKTMTFLPLLRVMSLTVS